MIGVLFFAATIPLSAIVAERIGRLPTLLIARRSRSPRSACCSSRCSAAAAHVSVVVFLSLGLACMGLTYGPLGTALAELFPTAVRYTGASVAFNLAGILGGSLAPYIATSLAARYGIAAVGYYLSAASVLTFAALAALAARAARGVRGSRARIRRPNPRI